MSELEAIEKTEFDRGLEHTGYEKVPFCSPEDSIGKVLETMQSTKHGALLLCEGESIVGIISEQDILRKGQLESLEWCDTKVGQVMTKNPICLPHDAKISDSIKLMASRNFRHIPITKDGKYDGLLSIKDLIAFMIKFFPSKVAVFGTKVDWTHLTVDDYTEAFSFTHENKDMISGNIFMAHLKRVSHNLPIVLDVNCSVSDVVELLQSRKKGAVLLMEYETKLKGIITERDLLFKVFGKEKVDGTLRASQFMTPNPHILLSKHYIAHAINNMFSYNYRNSIVVNEDRYPVSVISLLEVFKFVAFQFFGEEVSLIQRNEAGDIIFKNPTAQKES